MNQEPPSKKLKSDSDSDQVSSSSALETIPVEQLGNYNLFRLSHKKEDREILKNARLAYVFGDTGLIVTTKDEVYSVGEVDGSIIDDDDMDFEKQLKIITEFCGLKIKDFVSGSSDCCFAITDEGAVFSWGLSNAWGQLGNGTMEKSEVPRKLGGDLEGKCVVQLAACESHVLALTKEGDVYGWGNNDEQQVTEGGDTIVTPTRILFFDDGRVVATIACCRDGSAAILNNGDLYYWGWERHSTEIKSVTTQRFKKIIAGEFCIYALSGKGDLYQIYRNDVYDMYTSNESWKVNDFAADSKSNLVVIDFPDEIGVGRQVEDGLFKLIQSLKADRSASLESVFASYAQTTYQSLKPIMRPDEMECLTNTPGQSLKNLWLDGDSNDIPKDVTFLLKGQCQISAHKPIIMMRSDYFRIMFNGSWKESGKKDIVIGGEIESTAFKAYLTYLYTNEIAFLDSDFENIFGLMKLADSYLDIGLRRKCEKVLIRRVDMNNVLFLMRNSGSVNAQDLEKRALEYLVDQRIAVSKRWTPDQLSKQLGKEAHGKLTFALLTFFS